MRSRGSWPCRRFYGALMGHPSPSCRRRSCPGFGSGFGNGMRINRIFPSPLLDDLGYHEEAVRFRGRVAEGVFVADGWAHLVRAGDVDQRKGVSGGLDSGDVHFLQLLDVAEDVAQLRADLLLLIGGERQSREVGHILDVNLNRGHGIVTSLQGCKVTWDGWKRWDGCGA